MREIVCSRSSSLSELCPSDGLGKKSLNTAQRLRHLWGELDAGQSACRKSHRACVDERSSSQLVSCKEEILKRQSERLTNRSAKSAPCREQWREWRSGLNFVTCDHRFVLDQDEMMNEKCTRSPQFSPHPPHELFLRCVNSILSRWHSCLLEFLPAHGTAKSWRLSDLQKPTSCLREIHRGSSKKTIGF